MYIDIAAKQKYQQAKKAIFRVEKDKLRSLKYIAVGLDTNVGDLINEGIDVILERYRKHIPTT